MPKSESDLRRIIREEFTAFGRDSRYAPSRVPFHTHNNLDAPKLRFIGLSDTPASLDDNAGNMLLVNSTETALEFFNGYFAVAANTNGTTNVNVFSASGAPFGLTVTGVFLISKDTTAGDITVVNAGNTVCTIAKGTTAAVMVGATSLSNTTVAKGASFQVDSSSAGNATVFITFVT